MANNLAGKSWLLKTALAYLGTPYVWGGDDPSGFDCSGYVVECLKSCGLLGEQEDLTADGLFARFGHAVIGQPEEAALMFYFDPNNRATHVTICLDEEFQIGAAGGDSRTKDTVIAWRQNAFIKIRPIRFRPTQMRVVRTF